MLALNLGASLALLHGPSFFFGQVRRELAQRPMIPTGQRWNLPKPRLITPAPMFSRGDHPTVKTCPLLQR
jgi:hypothetical protein